MAQNYTRQSSFADGDTITAALFNNEFNQVVNAFSYSASSDSSTGHKHDGTTGQGGNIPQIGDINFNNKIVVDTTNNRWGVFVEVSGSPVEQIRIQDGAIVPVTDSDIDLGTSSLEFKDLFLDGTAHIDTLDVDVNATVAGTLGVTGVLTATSLDISGDIDVDGTTNLDIVDIDGAVNIAAATTIATDNKIQFRDTAIYVNSSTDGQLDIVADTEVQIAATTVDINGAVDISGNLDVGGNLVVTGTTTFNGGTLTLGDAASDNVVFGADVNSNIIPNTDSAFDLGSSTQEWRDLYLDGTAHIDTLDVDVNATIAGTLGVTGVLTGSSLDISGDIDIDGTANLDVVDIDGAVDMASTLTVAGVLTGASLDISGDIDVDGTSNLDIVDIDGAVDMATTLTVAGNVDFNGDLDVDGVTNLDVVDIDGAVDMATTLTVTGNVDFNGDLDVDGTTNLDVVDIDGAVNMATTLLVTGNVDFNGDLDVDGVTNLDVVDIDGAVDMASTLGVTGVATLASLVATTADINGGTIDGATIATSDITVGSGKTLNVSAGTLTLADNQISGDKVEGGTIAATTITTLTSTTGNITSVNATTVDTTNLEVTTLKSKDGTVAGSIADSTGIVTVASSVLTTTDINGGTIDGVTIGGASAGDITYANLSDGTITVTAFADEDDMSSNSATLVPTQQSVKAYVDSQVTAQDLDFAGDTGGALSIDLDSESLTIAGGTGLDTVGSGNTVTVNIDSTVTTLTGTQTLTNKTLTSPDVNTPDIDGGTIDGTVIGGATPAAGTFTTLTANTSITGTLATAAQTNITSVGTLSSLTTSGNVIVGGNLTVNGTTTTLNTATLDVEDKNITLNYGSGDTTGSASGAGITIQDAVNASTDASILWDTTNDEFDFSHPINVTGKITGTGTSVFTNLDISGDVDVDGTTNLDVVDIDGAVDMASTLTVASNIVVGGTVDGRDVATDGTKLDTIETSATADQTDAEIRTAVEAASDSNVFTDADHSKLNAIEASADVTDTANVTAAGAVMDSELTSIADVKALNQSVVSGATPTFTTTNFTDATNKRLMTDAQETKLDSVESGATADQTNAEIRAAVEAATDSNVFTDADHSKLNAIEAAATGDQSNAEIRAAVEAATDSNVFTDADHSKLNGIAPSANNYVLPTNLAGDDINIDTGALSGATVISDLDFNITTNTSGLVTDANASVATRTLTLANLGYTGATNANYITNNNQLTNGAGYTTNTGTVTSVALTTSAGLDGGGTINSSGTFSISLDLGELTDMTAAVDGSVDELILLDNGAQRRKRVGEITLSDFSNDLGNYGGWVTSSGNTVIGTDTDIDTSGATIIDSLTMTDGVITSHGTRTLTLANLGYTGAADANNTVTNATHTGEVTGSGALTIANDVVDAGNLKVTGNGTTSQFLRSDGDGTFTWATPTNTTYSVGDGGLSEINFTSADHSKLNGIAPSANNYVLPTNLAGDDINIDTGALTGATVISDLDFNITTNSSGLVTDANGSVATRTLTLANLGYTGAANANYITNNNQLTNGAGYVTSSGNTIIGTDTDIDTSGSTIIDSLTMTDGVITAHGTRSLGIGDLITSAATSSGKLSIGTTTTPTHQLEVYGHGIRLGISNANVYGRSESHWVQYNGGSTANDTYMRVAAVNASSIGQCIQFFTDEAERIKIDDVGDTFFGLSTKTTTPTYGGVYISGDRSVGNTNSYPQMFVVHKSTNNHGIIIKELHSSGYAMQFLNASGSQVGAIQTGSGTSFVTSSDSRLKDNIQDADDPGSKIDAIQVRKFDWKADGSHQDYGMIAQELQEVVPRAVPPVKDDETMLGVDYASLVPMLIKEIQSLRARVNALETE